MSDVAVVGGGAIGLATAWRCATKGMDVTVVDESPGLGSSWAAAGLLAPVTELHYGEEQLLRLNVASSERYPAFVSELEDAAGMCVGYRRCGTLAVARDTDDVAALDDLYRFQMSLGLDAERLRGRECRELEPALAPNVRGGILVEGDHAVDNRALVEALLNACEKVGVDVRGGRVAEITTRAERVDGILLEGGERIACPKVVLAAGCWSGEIAGIPPDASPPVRPVKGQLVYLTGPEERELVTRNVRGVDIYVIPRGDGRVVLGATVEEQGFDTTITAEAVYTLLRDAWEVIPGILELELSECVVGLRPGSPDNAPMLGATSVEGLVVATGHYRNGILLTPITADSIATLLMTDETPELIRPFSPQRFQHVADITS